MPDDVIRLTLPPDADLGSVVVAALGALARGAGFGAAAVDQIREAAATAFLNVLDHGDEGAPVEVEAWAHRPEWSFEIRRSGWTETHRQPDQG